MPADWKSSRVNIYQQSDYQPNSSAYDTQLLAFYNTNMRAIVRMHPWTFLRRTAVVRLYADYATGTATFTANSRVVTGSGTAWTSTMAGSWIQAATSSFSIRRWHRIGRVASATSLFLEDPFPGVTATGSVFTIRQRFVPMPRDCLNYQTTTDPQQKQGMLWYVPPDEADASMYNEDTTGTPRLYTDADPWSPRTPERALTATLAAGGSLVAGRVYVYKWTWQVGDTETGSSPTVEATPTGATLKVSLSGFQEIDSAVYGQSAVLYRAEKDVGIFYKLADVTSDPYVDDGTVTLDRSLTYYDANQRQYIRPFPRLGAGSDELDVNVRYHFLPREIQKDSDYLEMPDDVCDVVRAMTVVDVLRTKANASAATLDVWGEVVKNGIRSMEKRYMAQAPNTTVRRPFSGGAMRWITGTDPSVTSR